MEQFEERRKDWSIPSKDLYDMIQELKGVVYNLTLGLQETNNNIKRYNGLKDQIAEVQEGHLAILANCKTKNKEWDDYISTKRGKQMTGEGIIKWSGWIIMILMTLFNVYKIFN